MFKIGLASFRAIPRPSFDSKEAGGGGGGGYTEKWEEGRREGRGRRWKVEIGDKDLRPWTITLEHHVSG